MSLLVDWEILKMMKAGAIVIEPFHEDQLSDNAYDLTVGDLIWRYPASEHEEFRLEKINPDVGSFLIQSGERVLGHSRERAGGRVAMVPYDGKLNFPETERAVSTHIQATSTAARRAWQACGCAGLGNVGFTKPWTFEITNCAPYSQRLPYGAIIAQVCFTEVAVPTNVYGKDHGQYQHEGEEWTPEMMLPGPLKVRK